MSDDITAAAEVRATRSSWPRKLRIAVSVFFGLLTVMLVILWARSASFDASRLGNRGTIDRAYVHLEVRSDGNLSA